MSSVESREAAGVPHRIRVVSLVEVRDRREGRFASSGRPGGVWATVVEVGVGDDATRGWGWRRVRGEWRPLRPGGAKPYDLSIRARVCSPSFHETRAEFVSPLHGSRAIVLPRWSRRAAYATIRELVDGIAADNPLDFAQQARRHFWVDIPDDPHWFDEPAGDDF
ncbi:hypothetical protein [Cellulomonas sp.]|uniref:hypothetical protein n=1 Tax=Cellulomonas sp. TaxID=40001 RepID=UPI001B1088F4|nr:hypothetical protein [Cellulomonas sp.]MBO9556753.1 hypothetical protein [Cellulomonas sp.]